MAAAALGLSGLSLLDEQPSPQSKGRSSNFAEEEEASLLVTEDEPTPGFECLDRGMLRLKRRLGLLAHRRRWVLATGAVAFVWYIFSATSLFGGRRTCTRRLPRIFSHRGFDASEALYDVTTQRSLRDLLDYGLRSFDLDLFWTLDDPDETLYIGHPPSQQ